MAFSTIDLNVGREERNTDLANCIVQSANDKKMTLNQVVGMILGSVLGNTLVDEELEESLVIGLAASFDCDTKNPQHETNGGHEGNTEDDG